MIARASTSTASNSITEVAPGRAISLKDNTTIKRHDLERISLHLLAYGVELQSEACDAELFVDLFWLRSHLGRPQKISPSNFVATADARSVSMRNAYSFACVCVAPSSPPGEPSSSSAISISDRNRSHRAVRANAKLHNSFRLPALS